MYVSKYLCMLRNNLLPLQWLCLTSYHKLRCSPSLWKTYWMQTMLNLLFLKLFFFLIKILSSFKPTTENFSDHLAFVICHRLFRNSWANYYQCLRWTWTNLLFFVYPNSNTQYMLWRQTWPLSNWNSKHLFKITGPNLLWNSRDDPIMIFYQTSHFASYFLPKILCYEVELL